MDSLIVGIAVGRPLFGHFRITLLNLAKAMRQFGNDLRQLVSTLPLGSPNCRPARISSAHDLQLPIRMKDYLIPVFVSIVSVILATFLLAPGRADSIKWHESMRYMATTLTDLIPELNKPEVYITAAEKSAVIRNSKKFLGLVHTIKDNSNPPTFDPLVPMISNELKNQVEQSVKLMEAGQWSRGKHQMLDVSRHCIACHTLKQGPTSIPILDTNFDRLSFSQRANYFAATRQFDKALVNFESLLADKEWARTHQEEWNDAFQKLLAITIRVRNDPNLTFELLSRFFDADSYPSGLRKTAKIWRQHVKEWETETKKNSSAPTLLAMKALLEKAEKLQAGRREPVSFVLFLRASEQLHSYLSSRNQANNQEALLLAGRSAEGINDQNFWNYSEHYYSKCITTNKDSAIGKVCSERLKNLWRSVDVN